MTGEPRGQDKIERSEPGAVILQHPAGEGATEAAVTAPSQTGGHFSPRIFLYRYAVALALVVFLAGFSILLPTTYFTRGNFTTMLSSQAVLLVLSLGLTLPLAVGEFDLSISSMLGFAAILVAHAAHGHHRAIGCRQLGAKR